MGLDESFSLSQIESLLKVMDRCVADLRRVWNVIDPTAEQSRLSARARLKADYSTFIDARDYPREAQWRGQDGAVRFALLIDEGGGVADCTIVKTSGAAALDAQACGVMKNRAKFEPARDMSGKPAKDAIVSRITWVIP